MPEEASPLRLRASRACQTCSLRKVRCDATEVGLPCSRCRVDRSPNCLLATSKRGTYTRQPRLQSPYERITSPNGNGKTNGISKNNNTMPASSAHRLVTPPSDRRASTSASTQPSASSCSESFQTADVTYPVEFSNHLLREVRAPASIDTVESMRVARVDDRTMGSSEGQSSEAQPRPQQHRDSLTSMFERFLEQQGQNTEDATKCGIIFMSAASPLTFALEEAQGNSNKANLHEADADFSSGDGTGTVKGDNHPSHLSPQDIGYLKVKNAFERPSSEVSDVMLAAFIERFYPLYSIVDLDSLKESVKAGTLPWILLHAVCFIGATFCDMSVIHRAGFKGRWHARHQFYDKAKLLFDIGYETNKVVLLQTVLMLSFWGPQMKSYWNPCSWIGFGVTIAESLGIHRIGITNHLEPKRRNLLRRLFWVLAVRDAYCAALLGRPFRLNVAQCNTDALTLKDFDHDRYCNSDDHKSCQLYGHYQIQVSKLSMILRNIVEARSAPGKDTTNAVYLHNKLDRWQSELPTSLSWWLQLGTTSNTFALSLKIIFNLQLILIHLKRPDEVAAAAARGASIEPNASDSSSQIAESAAHMISSTAFIIMTNSMLGVMPHEVFFGFFVSGIVFYRSIKQQPDAVACSPRSALDNCQMVISEARERWDPANWVMRIFDFLLSISINTPDSGTRTEWDKSTPGNYPQGPGVPLDNDSSIPNMASKDDILHSIDFDSPNYHGTSSMANEFFMMANYLPMPTGDTSYMTTWADRRVQDLHSIWCK